MVPQMLNCFIQIMYADREQFIRMQLITRLTFRWVLNENLLFMRVNKKTPFPSFKKKWVGKLFLENIFQSYVSDSNLKKKTEYFLLIKILKCVNWTYCLYSKVLIHLEDILIASKIS